MVAIKMKKSSLFILLLTSLCAGSSFATSFDCTKAKSFAEKSICSNPHLSERDDALKVIYDNAKSVVANKKLFSDATRQLWNARERCNNLECIVEWYDDAFVIYKAVIIKAGEDSESNRVGNGKEGVAIKKDGDVAVVNPKITYQLRNEAAFIDIVRKSMIDAGNAKNDMQVGGIKSVRDKGICNLLTVKSISNWIGEVKQITANSDGKGVMVLSLPNNILIRTWNNSFSDMRDKTLIEPGTKLFSDASELSPGDVVYFSGSFFEDENNCISEGSLTLSGKIKEPEFIFKFSDVRKYQQ